MRTHKEGTAVAAATVITKTGLRCVSYVSLLLTSNRQSSRIYAAAKTPNREHETLKQTPQPKPGSRIEIVSISGLVI